MDNLKALRCPVCRAKFRGTRQCSRCGADLTAVMTLIARAQHHRNNARKSLQVLNFKEAHKLAAAAQKEHATETGRKLQLLTSWLNSGLFV